MYVGGIWMWKLMLVMYEPSGLSSGVVLLEWNIK